MAKRESTSFAFVAESYKLRKKKYQASRTGICTCDTSLTFLVEQLLDKPKNKLEDGSFNFNFGVISKNPGVNSGVGKRLVNYQFSERDLKGVEMIFINGVVPKGRVNRIVHTFLKVLRKYDSKATMKKWHKSDYLDDALDDAVDRAVLVSGVYQDAGDDLELLDEDGEASLFLRYIELGLDYNPMFSNFEENPVKKDIDGEEISINELSNSAIVTRTSLKYLRDFSTSKRAGNFPNLKFIQTKDNEGFWNGTIQQVDMQQLDDYFFNRLPDDVADEIFDCDYLRITYTFKDTDLIKEKAIETEDDAILVFSGYVEFDINKKSKIDFWESEDGERFSSFFGAKNSTILYN